MNRINIIVILLFLIYSLPLFSATKLEINKEIFVNNQAVSIEELIEFWQYIRSDKKDGLHVKRIDDLFLDVDIESNINIGINDNLELGYIKRETYSLKASEDIVACFFDEDAADGEYQVKADYIIQELNGIYLSKYFQKGSGIKVGITGKLLNGVKLERQFYEGIIEKEGEKRFYTGRRISLDSDFYNKTDLYEVDFSSYGWGLDLSCQWQLNEQGQLGIFLENIRSRIFWEDVFTEHMNYYQASLGLYGNKAVGSSSSGIISFKDYQTRLPGKYKLSYFTDKYSLGVDYYRNEYYPNLSYHINEYLMLGLYKDKFQLALNTKWFIIDLKSEQMDLFSAEKAMVRILLKLCF